MGTHLRVLSESYPMNTNMIGFRWFSKIFASLCFGRTLQASALIGLSNLFAAVKWYGICCLLSVVAAALLQLQCMAALLNEYCMCDLRVRIRNGRVDCLAICSRDRPDKSRLFLPRYGGDIPSPRRWRRAIKH